MSSVLVRRITVPGASVTGSPRISAAMNGASSVATAPAASSGSGSGSCAPDATFHPLRDLPIRIR